MCCGYSDDCGALLLNRYDSVSSLPCQHIPVVVIHCDSYLAFSEVILIIHISTSALVNVKSLVQTKIFAKKREVKAFYPVKAFRVLTKDSIRCARDPLVVLGYEPLSQYFSRYSSVWMNCLEL